MIGMHLPPMLRSLHEATGVSIWIATFALAYLARLASDRPAEPREARLSASQPAAMPAARTTMAHSLAVIVARGAEH
jgi:hypothetical protein